MKVKNKILLVIIFFTLFIAFSFTGIYYYYHDEINLIRNNLGLFADYTSGKLFRDKKRNIDILHYDIDIELFSSDQKIIAKTTIAGKFTDTMRELIVLDFYDNFKINSVQLNGVATKYWFEDEQLLIENQKVNYDTFYVAVEYEGTPKNLGFGSFVFGEWNDNDMIYTLNEPAFASTWFPCNDVPTDKALVNISITNDSSMVSVSNGKLDSVEKIGDKKKYNWSVLYPISTYLIAIYSASYQSFSQQYITSSNDTMSIDYFVLPEKLEDAKRAFSDHPLYIKVFSDLFGDYPFIDEKYGVAQIPWSQGAMESQTITGVGTNFISKAKFFSSILIHEVAHHWWGNSVTPKRWKDIWLNEGFATYSEALYWEKTNGKSALKSTMESFRKNTDSGRLFDPGKNIFSRMIYNKGAWILHMLRKELGDSLFFNSLRNYYRKFEYKNADTDDFKNICEETSKKNLNKFFDQWVYIGTGKIELNYKWEVVEFNNNKKQISISILQTQDAYKCYNFPLDILVSENDGNEFISSHYITPRDTVLKIDVLNNISSVELDPNGWLLAEFNLLAE